MNFVVSYLNFEYINLKVQKLRKTTPPPLSEGWLRAWVRDVAIGGVSVRVLSQNEWS